MTKFKKACLLATLGSALILPAAAMAANQVSSFDSVRDKTGSVVKSKSGDCVRTKWSSSSSNCSAMPASARHLTKEQRTVYFDFNKSTLNAKEKAKLDSLAKVIAASKEVASVDIVGHADKIGKAGYNKALSNKRAETVKSFLSAKGLKTRKVHVEGVGSDQSVTNCDSSDRKEQISCLAADRRVEIELNFVK